MNARLDEVERTMLRVSGQYMRPHCNTDRGRHALRCGACGAHPSLDAQIEHLKRRLEYLEWFVIHIHQIRQAVFPPPK